MRKVTNLAGVIAASLALAINSEVNASIPKSDYIKQNNTLEDSVREIRIIGLSEPLTPEKYLIDAKIYFEEGNANMAKRILKLATEKFPWYGEAYLHYASFCYADKELDKAEENVEKFLQLINKRKMNGEEKNRYMLLLHHAYGLLWWVKRDKALKQLDVQEYRQAFNALVSACTIQPGQDCKQELKKAKKVLGLKEYEIATEIRKAMKEISSHMPDVTFKVSFDEFMELMNSE